MNKQLNFGAAVLLGTTALAGLTGRPASADTITMTIVAAEAPNAFGSPSYSAWAANAIYAAEHGLSSYGTPGTPSYYQEVTSGTDSSNIVTSFPSWNGVANPPPPFSHELGNRLTYTVIVTDSTGADISLSELRGLMTSSDPLNTFGFTYNWSTGQLAYSGGTYTSPTNYSAGQVGLITGDLTPITSGPATQLVNELIVTGFGNALANTSSAACKALGSSQAAINCVEAQYKALMPFDITATFSLVGTPNGTISASDSVPFPAPEPGTLTLFGSAVAGLGLLGKRRRKA